MYLVRLLPLSPPRLCHPGLSYSDHGRVCRCPPGLPQAGHHDPDHLLHGPCWGWGRGRSFRERRAARDETSAIQRLRKVTCLFSRDEGGGGGGEGREGGGEGGVSLNFTLECIYIISSMFQ